MKRNLAYFGSRISENIAETPEGFLVCRSVPIARTGVQTYLPEEIGLPGGAPVSVPDFTCGKWYMRNDLAELEYSLDRKKN